MTNSLITNIETIIRDRKQTSFLFLNNFYKPLRINSGVITKLSGLESREFELLIGREISWKYFSIGDVIDKETGEECQKGNTLVDIIKLDLKNLSVEELRNSGIGRITLFEKIISIQQNELSKKSLKIITDKQSEYEFPLSPNDYITQFSWELFLFHDAYCYSLYEGKQIINVNFKLRLDPSFFWRIAHVDEKAKKYCQGVYDIVSLGFDPIDRMARRPKGGYDMNNFVDDALGGEASAISNIE